MPTIKAILAKSRPLHCVREEQTVIDAVKTMVDNNVGALPVLKNDRLSGVFSERDLMRRVIVAGHDPSRVTVGEVMSKEIVTADINDDHLTCLRKMSSCGCRHLPVIEGNRLVGFLSARDLMREEVEGKEIEIQTLRDFIYYVPPKAT